MWRIRLGAAGNFILRIVSISHQFSQDVVKQRLQIQTNSLRKDSLGVGIENLRYRGSLHCIQTIIKEEGFFALWTVQDFFNVALYADWLYRDSCQRWQCIVLSSVFISPPTKSRNRYSNANWRCHWTSSQLGAT